MNELQLKLCDIQGRLFELSAEKKYNSAAFIKAFMMSDTAKELDSKYNRMQWAGEEYLLEEVASVADESLTRNGEIFSLSVKNRAHKTSATNCIHAYFYLRNRHIIATVFKHFLI